MLWWHKEWEWIYGRGSRGLLAGDMNIGIGGPGSEAGEQRIRAV